MSRRLSQSLRPLALAALLATPAFAAPGDGNGWVHFTPWTAEVPAALDSYGWQIELGDDWAFVLNRGSNAVDVYALNSGTWSRVQELTDPDGDIPQFGRDIELHGDELYISSPTSDIAGDTAGAVHRYRLVDDSWEFLESIVSPWSHASERFGQAVAVDGLWLAVGSHHAGPDGAIDVFRKAGDTWVPHTRMEHPEASTLGMSLAMEATDDGLYANIFGGDTNAYSHQGAVFHFRANPFGYQIGPVTQAPEVHEFGYGYSIDVDDGHLVVGSSFAPQDGVHTGAAFVYDVDGDVFPPQIDLGATLFPEIGQDDSRFGKCVGIDGDRIAVGAPVAYTSEVATGGAVYVFRPDIFGEGWHLEDRVLRDDGEIGDFLGGTLALNGSHILAGAWGAGDSLHGEAVFFSLTSKHMDGGLAPSDTLATVRHYGEGKPGGMGVPVLSLSQAPVPGELTTIGVSNIPIGAQPVLFWSPVLETTKFDEGTLLVGQPLGMYILPAATLLNQVGVPWQLPDDVALAGVELFAQAMHVDPAGYGAYQTAQSRGMHVIVGY